MNEKFQDRIDDYLLGRMTDAEKDAFMKEVDQDEEKKELLEFTKNVKEAVCSRAEKLQALSEFQKRYENERHATLCSTGTESMASEARADDKVASHANMRSKKRVWLWISGAAAVLVVGFFVIKPVLTGGSSSDNIMLKEQIRGGDDVFIPMATDSTDNDTLEESDNVDKYE